MAGRPAPERPGRRRWMRRTLALLFGVLAVVVLGGPPAAWIWAERSVPPRAATARIEGLSAPARVIRDRNGVAHVFAATIEDAMAAQGFVHAQDRFAQMDAMRLVARGRLAELVGAPGVASDRFMRGLDLRGRAERALDAMSPENRRALDAYARGVNAFLESGQAARPLELRLAGRVPEPWLPLDSLLWGEIMAIHLAGNWRDELARMRLLAAGHDARLIRLLWPDWPADPATSLASLPAGWDPERLGAAIAATPPLPDPPHASNGWVFSGARTHSGKPLLANDPHLQLGAPGVWYLLRLEAPGLTLAGASAPGVPGVVLGHNGHVAWGMTTTGADAFDLVLEKLAPGGAGFMGPSGQEAFAVATHEIRVKGEREPRRVQVRRTPNGVVLADILASDVEAAPQGHVLALRAALDLGVNTTGDALLRMIRARDVAGLLDAAQGWRAPVQNLFAADRDGRIALAAIGAVPVRRGGDGSLPVPGWDEAYGWSRTIPSVSMPRAVDPPGGVLINANNRLIPDHAGMRITGDWDAPYRGLRLHEGLATATGQTVAHASAWQMDAVSVFARDFLGASAGWSPEDPELAAALALLRQWPATMHRDRPEPLVFNAWMRALRRSALAQLLGEADAATQAAGREAPALLMAVAAGDPWLCARLDCEAALARSLRDALSALARRYGQRIEDWRWGKAHAATFENPVWRSVPVLSWLFGFRVPVDGDNFTVNRATPRNAADLTEFPAIHGAGFRAIYDLSDLDRSLFAIAPGQSGHPTSRHWGDLAARWASGASLAIVGGAEDLERHGANLDLRPP